MKKRAFLLTSTLLLLLIASAQKKLPDFGKVDMADMQLKSCHFEKDADAMKLFDVQEVEFELAPYLMKLTTERRVRVKIFNEKGYKYASIRIPYYSKKRSTKIKDLEGVVYNLDAAGNIVSQKLEKKDFFKEKAQDNIGIINFTFPNLKPGSIIEFRYRKIEKDIYQIDPWIAQDEMPTAYASNVIITPTDSRTRTKIYGADTIEERSERLSKGSFHRTKRTYYRENIPSFRSEPFMSSAKDNLLKVIFLHIPIGSFFLDIITSSADGMWRMAGTSLMNATNFGGQIKKNIPGTERLIDSAKKINPVADRIKFLYDTVKKRAPENAEQTMHAGSLEEAWNDKTGNTAEINLILLNLLQKSGVKAWPFLISTRDNGKIDTKFPSGGQLNGVDVLATDSNKVYILDASLKFQSPYTPPLNILNRQGYLLGDSLQWVIVDDERSLLKQNLNLQAQLNADGTVSGDAYSWYYDYAKSFIRDTTEKDDEEDKFLDKKPVGLKIISIQQQDAEDDTKPLLQKISFTYEPQQTGDFYFINPQLFSGKRENPFTSDIRNTDIDLGCNQEFNSRFHLNIPPEFQVENLPSSIIVRAPDSSFYFKRNVVADSNTVFIMQNFEIKRSLFYREQYEGIREFFKKVYALMAEEIVLKKKK